MIIDKIIENVFFDLTGMANIEIKNKTQNTINRFTI